MKLTAKSNWSGYDVMLALFGLAILIYIISKCF